MFHKVLKGKPVTYEAGEEKRIIPEWHGKTDRELQFLEEEYKKYDLLFHGVHIFGDPEKKTQDCDSIMEKKRALSDRIIQILSKQKLSKRRCKECGRTLPWNYPHGMCQNCHDTMYQYAKYF